MFKITIYNINAFYFFIYFYKCQKSKSIIQRDFSSEEKFSNDLDLLAEFKSIIFRNKINLNTIVFDFNKYFI